MVTATSWGYCWLKYTGVWNEKSQLKSWLKNKERTKVPEKFVNSVDFPHIAAEVQLGSSAMGDTA
jgi:hypothetical protein